MQDRLGHNHRIALRADRELSRLALSQADIAVILAEGHHARSSAELERTCWQGNPHAPSDRAHAAREALRAAHARRVRLIDEQMDYDDELIDRDDIDDLAA